MSSWFLKLLELLFSCCLTDEAGFAEAVQELPLLEDLELSLFDNVGGSSSYDVVGDVCKQHKHFRLNKHHPDVRKAIGMDNDLPGIASMMHQLRSLQLFGNTLSSKGLKPILDNCPQPESLALAVVMSGFTTGKPTFVVRQILCRAFYFGRTAKRLFAVRFYRAHDRKMHGKQTLWRAPGRNAQRRSFCRAFYFLAHNKHFSPTGC
jgi:hypothetical protein